MKNQKSVWSPARPVMAALLLAVVGGQAQADSTEKRPPACQVLMAHRVFDGAGLHSDAAVLLKKDKVARVGPAGQLKKACRNRRDLGGQPSCQGSSNPTRISLFRRSLRPPC